MLVDTDRLPTHVALVARRLNVCSPDDLAATFLETSYLAETVIKSLAIVLYSGLTKPAREIAYRHAYELLRADGLGTWELVIRAISAQPTAAYLPPTFQLVLAWINKKRTKPEDEWFRAALKDVQAVLSLLGTPDRSENRSPTLKDLVSSLVQVRNKTKAHGAVGTDFYLAANSPYRSAVKALISECPFLGWRWLHLTARKIGSLRAVLLTGTTPTHLRQDEISELQQIADTLDGEGVYFVPHQSSRAYYTGSLLRANRDCSTFSLPNGQANDEAAEFLDYGSGRASRESIREFTAPPVPLPPSETEGGDSLDIQSNTFGNLPELPEAYVKRPVLEQRVIERLLDTNHPIITLHGGGGMGKTSLALAVAHHLAAESSPPFEHVVWFSARDIDLRPAGPAEVQPSVVDLASVSRRFGRLFAGWGAGGDTPDALARVLRDPSSISPKGMLFIFDNFETMSEAKGLHRFLDEHTHLPNKVLITSRERAFVADYPIEVRGMEPGEAREMLLRSGRELGFEGLMTQDTIDSIYRFTGGHAYAMRVIVGEMAKEGRFVPPPAVLGRRGDIVDAVFERSFNRLSEAGRNAFLLVANWKADVPELGLVVVLGIRGVDAISGLDECCRLSLLHRLDVSGDQAFYSAPALARHFAHKKLQGDPDRLVFQQDLATLHRFGVTSATAGPNAERQLIESFVRGCVASIESEPKDIANADRLLEALANNWPAAWLELARFRWRAGSPQESVDYALRRAVEEDPYRKEPWLERANFATQVGNEALAVASLVSAVDASPGDVDLVSNVALRLCRYINDHSAEIPPMRRGVYLASVRTHMERLANQLDATALSRLAWLFLFEGNVEKATRYADMGCAIDPRNQHCLKILERVARQA